MSLLRMESDDIYNPSVLAHDISNVYVATSTPARGRSRSNESATGGATPDEFRPRSDSTDSRGSVSSVGSGRYEQRMYVSTVQRDVAHIPAPATSRPPDYEIPAQPRVRTHTGINYTLAGPPGSAQPTNVYQPPTHQVQINVDPASMGSGGYMNQGAMASGYGTQAQHHTPPRTVYGAPPQGYSVVPSNPNHGHAAPMQTTPPGVSMYPPSSMYDPRSGAHHAWQETVDNTRHATHYPEGLAERPAGFEKALPPSASRVNNTGYSPGSPHSWQGLPPGVPQQMHTGSPSTPPQPTSLHSGYSQNPTNTTQTSTHHVPVSSPSYPYPVTPPHLTSHHTPANHASFVAIANIDMSSSSELQQQDLYKPTRSTHQQPLVLGQGAYGGSSPMPNNYPPNPGPVSLPPVSSQTGQPLHHQHTPRYQQPLHNQAHWQHHHPHSQQRFGVPHHTNLMDTPLAVMPQGQAPIQPQSLIPEQPVLHIDWNRQAAETATEPSPIEGKASRSESVNSDDQHYTQSLVLHQRARMDKLVKDLDDGKRMLNELKADVEQLETTATHRRYARSNSFPKIDDVQRLRADACKLQVDIQLLTRQMDLQDSVKPVANPQDPSFYNSLQPGQRGSVHTPSLEMPSAPPPQHQPSQRMPPARPPPPVPRPITSISRLPPEPLNDDDNVERWSCVACTFLNHPLLDKCETCEMPRVATNNRPR